MKEPTYRRILLKISGEAFLQEGRSGISGGALEKISGEIEELHRLGLQIAVVLGGGNLIRGTTAGTEGFDRVTADQMGMLATVINSLALQHHLGIHGVSSRILSAIEMGEIAEPYSRRKAVTFLEKGHVVLLAAGTGHPYFTTDTAASLRAVEIGAEVILKATKVDGVFDRDPDKEQDAVRMDEVSYTEVLNRNLGVMDATAISLCRDNRMPIIVFNLFAPSSIKRAATGERIGTLIKE